MQSIDFILDTLGHFVKRTDGPPPGIPAHMESDFERELTWLCEWHALTPIVLASLEKLALRPHLSRVTHERMKALAGAAARMTDDLLATAGSLASGFLRRDVEALFLGDVFFPAAVYPERHLRPVEKIEVLVRERDWRQVIETCRELGFGRSTHPAGVEGGQEALVYYQYHAPFVIENDKGDQLSIRLRLFNLGEPDRTEVAWERRGQTGSIHRIGFEDQLIQSCITYNMTHFGKLIHAVDIGLVLNRFGMEMNWDYIDERLRSRSVYPAVFFTLENVVRWLKLDPTLVKLSKPGAVRKKIFDMLWHANTDSFTTRRPDHFRRLRFCLLEVGDWGQKLRFLGRIISPRPG